MSNPAAARPDDPPGPPIVNRKVPVRRKNADYRSREYLSETEVAAVGAAAAAQGRHGLRDSTLILVAFRHGHASRDWWRSAGTRSIWHTACYTSTAPRTACRPCTRCGGRSCEPCAGCGAITRDTLCVRQRTQGAAHAGRRPQDRHPGWQAARLGFPIHPHMLRHATGYKLANDGRDTRSIQHYLGHRNIQHTTRYTQLAPDRFKDFWMD